MVGQAKCACWSAAFCYCLWVGECSTSVYCGDRVTRVTCVQCGTWVPRVQCVTWVPCLPSLHVACNTRHTHLLLIAEHFSVAADGCGVRDMRVAPATRYMRALRVVFYGEEGQECLPVGCPMMPLVALQWRVKCVQRVTCVKCLTCPRSMEPCVACDRCGYIWVSDLCAMRALRDVLFLRYMSGISQGTTTENRLRWGCVTCVRCATCVPTVWNAFASGQCRLRRFTFPASTARSAWNACSARNRRVRRLDLRVQYRSLYNNWAPLSVGVRDMRAVRYVRQPFWTTLSQAHVDRHRFTFPASTAGSACVTCVQCAKRSPFVQMSSRWCARFRVVPSALPSAWCVAPISGNFIMKDLPPVTVGFPAQRASNAENASKLWRHHGCLRMENCNQVYTYN